VFEIVEYISDKLNVDFVFLFNKFKLHNFNQDDKKIIYRMNKYLNNYNTIKNLVYRYMFLNNIRFNKYKEYIRNNELVQQITNIYFNYLTSNYELYEILRYFEIVDSKLEYSSGINTEKIDPIKIEQDEVKSFLLIEFDKNKNLDIVIDEKYNIKNKDILPINIEARSMYEICSEKMFDHIDYNKHRHVLTYIPKLEQLMMDSLLINNRTIHMDQYNPFINILTFFVLSSPNINLNLENYPEYNPNVNNYFEKIKTIKFEEFELN
jgi:hypothetical protein